MSYIGQQLPADVFSGFVTDSFTGDGSATTFTLSKAPFSEDALIVVINNVIQKPVTNFTVSGTTLTIVGTAVASGDVIYAMHTSGAVPITQASKVDVNGLSDGVILDADADTTISADSDDQIDFKVGGTDIMSLTATTATINDGVTISVADNTDTLTLKSTDADAAVGPVLTLHRESSSPGDDDIIGRINFIGEDSGGTDTTYGRIETVIMQESNGSEDATMEFRIMKAGTERNVLELDRTEVCINEDAQNIATRIESASSSKAFFVNGEYGHCHISGNASTTKVSYYSSSMGSLQLGIGGGIFSYDYNVIDGPYMHNNLYFPAASAKYVGTGPTARMGMYNGQVMFHTGGSGSADGSVTETLRFQMANNGDLTATDTSIGSISDQRLKENIADHTYDIAKFKLFKPRTFDWKHPEAHTGEATTGFVAQELESVDSDWVYTTEWAGNSMNKNPKEDEEKALCNNEDKKAAKLSKKDAMYISVIQQLITRIEALEDA